jgi:hypothetical protein
MPTMIILQLAAMPILALSMLLGSTWSSDALAAAWLVLSASMVVVVSLGSSGCKPSPR